MNAITEKQLFAPVLCLKQATYNHAPATIISVANFISGSVVPNVDFDPAALHRLFAEGR